MSTNALWYLYVKGAAARLTQAPVEVPQWESVEEQEAAVAELDLRDWEALLSLHEEEHSRTCPDCYCDHCWSEGWNNPLDWQAITEAHDQAWDHW